MPIVIHQANISRAGSELLSYAINVSPCLVVTKIAIKYFQIQVIKIDVKNCQYLPIDENQ